MIDANDEVSFIKYLIGLSRHCIRNQRYKKNYFKETDFLIPESRIYLAF